MGMSKESKLIVFVAVLASLLEIIDSSIVNVALPTMMGNLGATLEDISMVITGYAIANAIILPVSAWLSERFGRRKYYLTCIILFTATSVLCGFAPNLETLIVFRILQGLAGGALLPTSQALIYEQFPKEKAGMAGAIFGMSVMVGPALGPVMGGFLTDNFGWRSIFNINLPLGLLALMIGLMVIKSPSHENAVAGQERAKPRLDTLGLTLLVLGIGCLQYVLERGEALDWYSSSTIIITSLISAIALPWFVMWQLKCEYPIINIRLFKEKVVQSGVILMALLGFFLYGVVFLLPVFLGRIYHYDATQIGIMFIPGSLVTMAMMPVIGKLLQAGKNPKVLIAVGFLGLELTLAFMAVLNPQSSQQHVMYSLYMRGLALSFLFVPINSSILSQFSGRELGQVSGMLNLFRQIGGSIGIAFVATMLNTRSHQNYTDMSSKVTAFDVQAQNFSQNISNGMASKMAESVGFDTAHRSGIQLLYYKVQQQVFMMTFLQLIFIMMIILAFAFIPVYTLKLKKGSVKPVDAH
ncbi:MFS transporter [Bdellovibrio sp. qaytius]|nr:MFS transporter [Bdellovibrio sp. qaytius]